MPSSAASSRLEQASRTRGPGERADPVDGPRGGGIAPAAPAATAVRTAYDAVAGAYDEQVAPSTWVRERLWQRLDALFGPGARVLDATAGTGRDALHLAARGVAVTACDLSPRMLGRLAARDSSIATRVADCANLAAAFPAERFDGVLSTFAGLNTVTDLAGFAGGAAGLLEPGGVLFVQLLNRLPVADLVRRFRRRGPRAGAAGVAVAWHGSRIVEIGGVPVPHRLHSPNRLYRRIFARDFELLRVGGQGVLRPVDDPPRPADPAQGTDPARGADPADVGEEAARRRHRWEERLSAWPWSRGLGTFFTLEMRRRAGAAAGAGAPSPAGPDPVELAPR
jgi:SAM-dependent methyltransferase